MSIVIVGGNEGMIGKYRELCEDYKCKVKVYAKDSLKLLFEMLTVTVEGLPLTVLEVLDSDHTVKVNI